MTCRLCKIISVLLIASFLFAVGMTASAEGVLLGDADGDGSVMIVDATCIQRYLAGLPISGDFSVQLADVNGSGVVEITDATYIQRWLAFMETPYAIGSPYEAPTEPTVVPPTQSSTDKDGWGHEIFQP